MIINFNVTGKETEEQLNIMGAEAFKQFQDDVGYSNDPRILENTWIVYAILAARLNSMFVLHKSVNEAHGNLELVPPIVNRIFIEIGTYEMALTNDYLSQIKDGTAKPRRLDGNVSTAN